MDKNEILARLASIMEDVLGVDASAVTLTSSPDSIPDWDSMKQIALIGAIEEAFEVQLSHDEMAQMLNVDIIVDILSEKVSGR